MATHRQHAFVPRDPPTPEKVDPIRNQHAQHIYHKPAGGLWTSPLDGDTCPWVEWCRETAPHMCDGKTLYALTPREDITLYVIDSDAHLRALLCDYEHEVGQNDLVPSVHAAIDFERFVAETTYDGIALTAAGQSATHHLDKGLNGWDCASTLWFEWCFTEVEAVRDLSFE